MSDTTEQLTHTHTHTYTQGIDVTTPTWDYSLVSNSKDVTFSRVSTLHVFTALDGQITFAARVETRS